MCLTIAQVFFLCDDRSFWLGACSTRVRGFRHVFPCSKIHFSLPAKLSWRSLFFRVLPWMSYFESNPVVHQVSPEQQIVYVRYHDQVPWHMPANSRMRPTGTEHQTNSALLQVHVATTAVCLLCRKIARRRLPSYVPLMFMCSSDGRSMHKSLSAQAYKNAQPTSNVIRSQLDDLVLADKDRTIRTAPRTDLRVSYHALLRHEPSPDYITSPMSLPA